MLKIKDDLMTEKTFDERLDEIFGPLGGRPVYNPGQAKPKPVHEQSKYKPSEEKFDKMLDDIFGPDVKGNYA